MHGPPPRPRPAGLLAPGDPRLDFSPDPARARATLIAYVPPDDAQARTRARILAFLDEHPDALQRRSAEGHLTASALVLDAERERALLVLHAKLGRWLQPGGHCDGDANLAGVALREAVEETGVADLAIDPRVVDLDVHAIPARPGEPEHLHLDTRFLVHAPPEADPRPSAESRALRWVSPDEVRELEGDESLLRLFRLAFGRPR